MFAAKVQAAAQARAEKAKRVAEARNIAHPRIASVVDKLQEELKMAYTPAPTTTTAPTPPPPPNLDSSPNTDVDTKSSRTVAVGPALTSIPSIPAPAMPVSAHLPTRSLTALQPPGRETIKFKQQVPSSASARTARRGIITGVKSYEVGVLVLVLGYILFGGGGTDAERDSADEGDSGDRGDSGGIDDACWQGRRGRQDAQNHDTWRLYSGARVSTRLHEPIGHTSGSYGSTSAPTAYHA